jgi:hypothetical protein
VCLKEPIELLRPHRRIQIYTEHHDGHFG